MENMKGFYKFGSRGFVFPYSLGVYARNEWILFGLCFGSTKNGYFGEFPVSLGPSSNHYYQTAGQLEHHPHYYSCFANRR